MTMLESYVLGAGLVVGLMLGWVGVQAAWTRAFPEATGDSDALARRPGCISCACDAVCEREVGQVSVEEKTR